MNEDEQKEALLRFARTVGDAAGGVTLAFVALATGLRECTRAFERYVEQWNEPDDTDSA